MTLQTFKESYGGELAKFIKKPIFQALMELADEEGPVGQSPEMSPGNVVAGGHVLYAEIQGFERFRKLLKLAAELPAPTPEEATYTEDPT